MTVVNKTVCSLGMKRHAAAKKRYKSESANLIVEALYWIEEGKKAKERLVEETRRLLNEKYTQHQQEYDELMCLKEEWSRKKR